MTIFDRVFIEKSQNKSFLAKNIVRALGKDSVQWLEDDALKPGALSRERIIEEILLERDPNKKGKKTLLVVRKKGVLPGKKIQAGLGGFYNKCPGTRGLLCCNYFIINPVSGCNFDCQYCFLQGYLDTPVITATGNLEEHLVLYGKWLSKRKNTFFRIGTGELSDSLSMDPVLGLGPRLIKFFAKFKNVQFELKTKSDNVDHLLDLPDKNNIIISFSVNPETIVRSVEKGTATLSRRLAAAARVALAGYKLAFHFDPIIFFPGWEREYQNVVKAIFAQVSADSIQYISLGVMRYFKELKEEIYRRHPDSILLKGPFTRGSDGKYRYYRPIREEIFTAMKEMILKEDPKQWIYFCMEGSQTWKNVFNLPVSTSRNLDVYFRKRRLLTGG